ncbi:MAG: hypothetical protein QE164_03970 [Candidatus Nezhaarchaeota archaeon]|nr:hypothetical protein [Candidatus Nezhaarchaeota archaeon]
MSSSSKALLAVILLSFTSLLNQRVVHAQNATINETLTSMYDNLLSGVKALVDKFLIGIQETLVYVLHKGVEVLITVARASYVALGLLGLVLWATGISPYRGRHLIVGSIILAIIAEVASGLLG